VLLPQPGLAGKVSDISFWGWGLEFTFRRDTPSRDISADITDLSQTAADTGASVTQDQNVILAEPSTSAAQRETLLNLNQPANINDIGRFTVSGELDDFTENLIEVNFNHKLSRRDTLSTLLSFSAFEAQSELTTAPEGDRDEDDREPNILRNPRFATTVDTIRASFGYERLLSPTFTAGIPMMVIQLC